MDTKQIEYHRPQLICYWTMKKKMITTRILNVLQCTVVSYFFSDIWYLSIIFEL